MTGFPDISTVPKLTNPREGFLGFLMVMIKIDGKYFILLNINYLRGSIYINKSHVIKRKGDSWETAHFPAVLPCG